MFHLGKEEDSLPFGYTYLHIRFPFLGETDRKVDRKVNSSSRVEGHTNITQKFEPLFSFRYTKQ